MKLDKLGWIAFTLLAGGVMGAGFQAKADKYGIVDIERVFNESNFAKQQTDNLRNMGQARQSVLEFLNTYRTLKKEDANRFKELTLKANLTPTEKAELDRIKNDAQASETKYRELTTKTGPTQADLNQISELNKRKDETAELLQQWQQDFMSEVETKRNGLRGEALTKVKAAVQKVARDQGFTLVFDAQIAPYAANDITEDALKAMNASR